VTDVVAVFDFDRTLSTRDNVVPFLVAVAGRRRARVALVRAAPLLARGQRERAKLLAARVVFAGRNAAEVAVVANRHADEIVERHLRADVVARLRWHQEQDHEVVIVSASFADYLRPVADELGVETVLATELEVGSDGRLTGRLAGANVRGAEKARRLDEWLGDRTVTVWAYGDSRGDRELLARADHPVRVGGARLAPAGK